MTRSRILSASLLPPAPPTYTGSTAALQRRYNQTCSSTLLYFLRLSCISAHFWHHATGLMKFAFLAFLGSFSIFEYPAQLAYNIDRHPFVNDTPTSVVISPLLHAYLHTDSIRSHPDLGASPGPVADRLAVTQAAKSQTVFGRRPIPVDTAVAS